MSTARAGAVGYLLLDASKRNDRSRAGNEVVHSVEELLTDIKAVLFHATPGSEQVAPHKGIAADERVLTGILRRLIEKTRQEAPQPEAAKPAPPPVVDDETMETVILSSRLPREHIVTPSPLIDTYVNQQSSSPLGTTQESTSGAAAEELLETVVLASPRTGRQYSPQVADERASSHPSQEKEAGDEADQLSETIVIMPQSGRFRPRFPRD